MTAREFCYWMQGMFELTDPKTLDERQTDLIKRHLAMVFLHEIDPSAGPPKMQELLDALHKQPPKDSASTGGHTAYDKLVRC